MTNQMKIIAISGKKHSGKDTVASMLMKRLPGTSVRVAFADELKLEIARNYHVTVPYIEGNKDTFRTVLQGHGSIQKFLHGEHYWIEQYLLRLHNCTHDGIYPDYVLTPDLRYKNEYNYLTDLGAIIIRVNRNLGELPDTHSSETDLDRVEFPLTIVNNSTMEFLEYNVEQLIEKIK